MIGRAVGVMSFASVLAACASAPPRPAPAPPPAAPRVVYDPPRICVVERGELKYVEAQYNTVTGDTVIGGRPFSEVHPPDAPGYAGAKRWYDQNEPIRLEEHNYLKYGLTRVLTINEVKPAGTHGGATFWAEMGAAKPYSVLYALVRPGCEFQPYYIDSHASAVRG